jgi:DNA primase
MKRIDSETVRKILDAADIVEVVSDFVKLRRAGANYKGLCPFHSERTPSFSVNRARNICKCFSCGKGGSPVNFIMELEQMSYQEALRYLARKYNIEIVEHEMSDTERQVASDRESMLAINEFALNRFESNLVDTDDGRNIGLAYFRERGINDAMIKRFHLGYALEKSDDLLSSAIAKGYSEKYLVDTGLCIKNDRGNVYDRFKGRVIYPVHSIAGRVVAFGGRTLRKDKNIAKYVNSPESLIYHKSNELYGMYQAKHAISKKDKCILVEGYMDVISMHQSGVENVVASSGTSLTEGQIRLIRRFTHNVTVIYDSDAAGIKASLRGIDMLLAAGLNIKVLSLPDGDDPDSYAQSHSASELEDYLATHEVDFIRFKTNILLRDSGDDPIKRAQVITDILRSVSVIDDEVTRTVYIAECSRMLQVQEQVLARQVAAMIGKRLEEDSRSAHRKQAEASIADLEPSPSQSASQPVESTAEFPAQPQAYPATTATNPTEQVIGKNQLEPYERELIRYVLKYGFLDFCDTVDENNNTVKITVLDYIINELNQDDIKLTVPLYDKVLHMVKQISESQWQEVLQSKKAECEQLRQDEMRKGEEIIRQEAKDIADIQNREVVLKDRCDSGYRKAITDFSSDYIRRTLTSIDDDDIRRLATELTTERHHLSRVHTKYSQIESEQDKLIELVPRAIYELKDAVVEKMLILLNEQLKALQPGEDEKMLRIIQELQDYQTLRNELAKYLGERIIIPRRR